MPLKSAILIQKVVLMARLRYMARPDAQRYFPFLTANTAPRASLTTKRGFEPEMPLKSAILIQKVEPEGQDALYGTPRRPALLSVPNREHGVACIPNHKTRF
jgi:hypothetical protein